MARGQALRIAKSANRAPPIICALALVFGKPVRHGRRRPSAANGLQRDADFLRLFGQVVFRRGGEAHSERGWSRRQKLFIYTVF